MSWIVAFLMMVSGRAFAANGNLEGLVRGPDSKPMEGVAISARAADQSYTTTVFTDQAGKYFFPPLETGQYKVWAQAKGYEYISSDLDLAGTGRSQKNFVLKSLTEYGKQLSGSEWLDSLPEQQPGDHRMKRVILNTCGAGCHTTSWILQNRFDQAGWNKIIDLMQKIVLGGYVDPSRPLVKLSVVGEPSPVIHAYRDEIVSYLARVRGAETVPLNYKAFRPKGEGTQVVITEWDLPPSSPPIYVGKHDGSNWSEGTPSALEAWGTHDCWPDKNGNVWFTDDISAGRTIGKVDTKTGKVTGYSLPDENGQATGGHGIVVGQNGDIWFNDQSRGTVDKFDPKTEKFQIFPLPAGAPRTVMSIVEDAKGNLWTPLDDGAGKLDPQTGRYTFYNSPTKGGGRYGIAVDAHGNAWYGRFGGDSLGLVDAETGKVTEIPLDDSKLPDVTEKDREIRRTVTVSGGTIGASPYQQAPRRPAADTNGNTVWFPGSYSDVLLKVDINTKQVTGYPFPSKYGLPYQAQVDKNHMVWVNLENADEVVKFDPFTEKWTEYLLPTRGAETHHMAVDNSTSPPTIYLPYYRTNKIARIQFRSHDSNGSMQ